MALKKRIYSIYNDFHFPFRVFTVSVLVIAILPSLIQDGMFIDGIQYAAISRNLANGLGTFWFPYLSENWYQAGSGSFLEHPPLVYAIQSIFFRVLGDGLYTERIYSFFTCIVSALLILKIWKLVTRKNRDIQKLSWLPVLLWVSMPIVFRSYQMNVQENTMGIFILAAVLSVIKGLDHGNYSYLYLVLGGGFIFLSTLCKGVPGLFPVVAVLMYWLAGRNMKFSRMVIYSLVLLSVPVLLYLLVLLNDSARESLDFYVTSRLLERIQHDPVVHSHLHILSRLVIELLPVIAFSLVFLLTRTTKKNLLLEKEYRTRILFFMLMGVAGSVPLALTLVQRDFYLAASLPFFAIGFALLMAPYLNELLKKVSESTLLFSLFRVLSISLLIGGLIYTGFMAGRAERDQDMLHDIYIIGNEIDEETPVRLDTKRGDNWKFELYFIRYFNISTGSPLRDSRYIIRSINDSPPEGGSYVLIPLQTTIYRLYRSVY